MFVYYVNYIDIDPIFTESSESKGYPLLEYVCVLSDWADF